MRGAWVVLTAAVAACGGGRKIVETEERAPEPAWAGDFTALVQAACDCKDAPCIRAKRPTADAMLSDHGGLDDAPASVHEGKAKLEVCWKDIARDLALDLEDVAKTICECNDSSCAQTYRDEIEAVTTKYTGGNPDALDTVPEATDASRAVRARIVGCVAAKTIRAADYLAATEASANELCACQADACTKSAIKNRFTAFSEYLFVGQDAALSAPIAMAEKRVCKCMADALKRGVEIEVGAIKGTLSVHMSCE